MDILRYFNVYFMAPFSLSRQRPPTAILIPTPAAEAVFHGLYLPADSYVTRTGLEGLHALGCRKVPRICSRRSDKMALWPCPNFYPLSSAAGESWFSRSFPTASKRGFFCLSCLTLVSDGELMLITAWTLNRERISGGARACGTFVVGCRNKIAFDIVV